MVADKRSKRCGRRRRTSCKVEWGALGRASIIDMVFGIISFAMVVLHRAPRSLVRGNIDDIDDNAIGV
jgi:hypothetical protein